MPYCRFYHVASLIGFQTLAKHHPPGCLAIWVANASNIFSLAPASLCFVTNGCWVFSKLLRTLWFGLLRWSPTFICIQPCPHQGLPVLSAFGGGLSVCIQGWRSHKNNENRKPEQTMGREQLPHSESQDKRGERWNLPDLSSFCESHLRHSSGMVLRDVTEY